MWVILASVSIAGAAIAPAPGDAGTATDAGSSQASALLLPSIGEYAAAIGGGDHTDWFRVNDVSSSPVCLSASVTGALNQPVHLKLLGADRDRPLTMAFADDVAKAGLATPSLTATLLRAKHDAGALLYNFEIKKVGLPDPVTGDALTGGDAGGTLAGALAVTHSCFGGQLSSVGALDLIDVYSVTAQAGDVIIYSLAAPGSDVTARLLDSTGAEVALPAQSGQAVSYVASTTGTYYVSTAYGGSSNSPYILGLHLGPDPGSSCRPYCYL